MQSELERKPSMIPRRTYSKHEQYIESDPQMFQKMKELESVKGPIHELLFAYSGDDKPGQRSLWYRIFKAIELPHLHKEFVITINNYVARTKGEGKTHTQSLLENYMRKQASITYKDA